MHRIQITLNVIIFRVVLKNTDNLFYITYMHIYAYDFICECSYKCVHMATCAYEYSYIHVYIYILNIQHLKII